jgi:hypothetical protein
VVSLAKPPVSKKLKNKLIAEIKKVTSGPEIWAFSFVPLG